VIDASVPDRRVMSTAGPLPEVIRLRRSAAVRPLWLGRYTLIVGLIALAYFGSALIGNALKFTGNVDALWPPVGVGIAALSILGLEFWPGVLLGDLLADAPNALPLDASVGQTVGNVLEVVVAAILIRRLVRKQPPLEHLEGLGRLAAILLAATALSATIGTASLRLGDVIAAHEVWSVWRTWWLGDSCGALVIVPIALAWAGQRRFHWPARRVVECAALVVAVVCLNIVALTAHDPLLYLVFPVLVWATLRFGARGGTFAVAVTATAAIWTTAHKLGPFAVHSISAETLRLQLYIGVSVASTLFASVMVGERRALTAEVTASRTRLIEAEDTERRRLERDLHDGAQQRLTALAFHLHAAAREREASRMRALLHDSARELSRAIDELRDLAHGIHPAVLAERGLGQAIREIAARASVPVRVTLDLPERRLDPVVESTAYYVVAEAVANAQRHSRASAMTLDARVAAGVLTLEIRDDGVGGARVTPGSGLEGLRDRVEGVRGSFALRSLHGSGTTIVVRLGLPAGT